MAFRGNHPTREFYLVRLYEQRKCSDIVLNDQVFYIKSGNVVIKRNRARKIIQLSYSYTLLLLYKKVFLFHNSNSEIDPYVR